MERFDLPVGEHGLHPDSGHGSLVGAPEGAPFRLRIDEGRAFLISHGTYSVDGVLFPPRVPRALLPGECAELFPGVLLQRLSDTKASDETNAVLRELLGCEEVESGKAARLWCLTGLDAGRPFPLIEGPNVLGRGVEAGVRLRERTVSKRHAVLELCDGEATLEELGGPNGVFVNGRKLSGKVLIKSGDVLELGRLLVRYDGPAEEPEPPEASAPEPVEEPAAAAPSAAAPTDAQTDADSAEDSEPTVRVSRWWQGDWALLTGAAGVAAGGLVLSFFFAP